MYPPDDGHDVIGDGEHGDRPAWRPGWAGRGTTALTAAALAVGLIAGYLAGHRPGRTPEPEPSRHTATTPAQASRRPTAQDVLPALTGTGKRCAVQRGTTLELGVEVANQSDHAVALGQFRAILPLGGLRAIGTSVGTCGALPAEGPTSPTIPAGATEWLTITFHVLVRCPVPLPVEFVVGYADSGKPATVQLDEFPDLGQVTYSGCPSTQ